MTKEEFEAVVSMALQSVKTQRIIESGDMVWERMSPTEADSVAMVAANAVRAHIEKQERADRILTFGPVGP
jgi:hypothetical protein